MLSSVPPPLTSETPAGNPVTLEVVAVVVSVADDDLVGAAFETALDDGVEVAAHEAARVLPFAGAVLDLGEPADPAHAFEIDADEDLHARPSVSSARGRRRRSTSAITISTTAIAAVTRNVISGPLDLAVTAPSPPLTGCT